MTAELELAPHWRRAAVLATALGGAGLLAGGWLDLRRAFGALLSNFTLFAGIAQAGVIFVAILVVSGARWAGPLRQVGLRFGAFLTAALGLFPIVALLGSHAGGAWPRWSLVSLLARDGAILLLLLTLSRIFQRALARASDGDDPARARIWAPILLIAYAYGWSWLAFDLLMGLAPEFVSTLFGAFVFIGNLYGALAATALVAALWARSPDGAARVPPQRLHDLGKLLFAFCLLWTYLLFSQILPIWYGNLPHETSYLVTRLARPWNLYGWVALSMAFGLPFVLLLGRAPKRKPSVLMVAASAILIGLWLERIWMVAPELSPAGPFGWIEISVTLGYAGAFTLSVCEAAGRTGTEA